MNEKQHHYLENLTALYKDKSSLVISNRKPEHFIQCLRCFFVNANRKIRIFTDNLNIYDDEEVVIDAKRAARNGVDIQIVIKEANVKGKFYQLAIQNNWIVNPAGASLFDKIQSISPNFIIVDDHAFRYQHGETAQVGFNDMGLADELNNLYCQIRDIIQK